MSKLCSSAALFPRDKARPKVMLYDFAQRNVNYIQALNCQRAMQQNLISARTSTAPSPAGAGCVFLLEHEPVYTFGRASQEHHVLDKQIQAIRSERGGEVTYHGPGQLVGYLILDLAYFKKDLHCLVSGMESVVISALQHEFAINTAARGGKGRTGVWVDQETKICAVGLSCKQWVTMHGFALNVNNNSLLGFNGIVPCGLGGATVTSVQQHTKSAKEIDMSRAKRSITTSLQDIFGMEFERGNVDELLRL